MSRILGIDIGKAVVRVAILRANYRKITLEALTETPVVGLEVDAIRAGRWCAQGRWRGDCHFR
jgi:general secretion pathway protein L